MISAVVVNWNGKHYLEDCLDSVLGQDPAPDEVLLVDNHSQDGSREFVAERYPDVRVIDTGYNAGPAVARNLGVGAARYERVLLVDNDVSLEPGALAHLVAKLEAKPAAAAVQARSVCADRPELVHYDATDIHYLGLLVLHNWFRERREAWDPERPIGGLVALCFLADRRRYLDVGGFNPAFFFFFEDTDLALRLRLRGHEIWLEPKALVRHGGGTAALSIRRAGARYPVHRVFLHSRNRWLLLGGCLRLRSLFWLLPAQLFYELIQFVFATCTLHPLAWLRGKLALLLLLPKILAWRRAAQEGRKVADRDLLVGGPLTLNPGLSDRGLKALCRRTLSTSFALYWKLFRRFCG